MVFSLIWQIYFASAIVEVGAIINNISSQNNNNKWSQSSENDGIAMSLKRLRKGTILPRQDRLDTSLGFFRWCPINKSDNGDVVGCFLFTAPIFRTKKCAQLPNIVGAVYTHEPPLKCKLYQSETCTDSVATLIQGHHFEIKLPTSNKNSICCSVNANDCGGATSFSAQTDI